MTAPVVRDTTAIQAYLEPLQQQLGARAAGGPALDVAKGLLALGSLVVTVPLALVWFFAHGDDSGPSLRWPWRTLENLNDDVEAAKTSVAHARLADSGERAKIFDDLYAVLEALDPDRRPLHATLAKLAADLDRLQRRLRSQAP